MTVKIIKISFFVSLLCLSAAGSMQAQSKTKAPKIIAYIIGTWTIQPVTSLNDATSANYPREITFDVEGKYSGIGKNGDKINGSYRINEISVKIYLDAGQGAKPEEWNVRFKNDRMILQDVAPSKKRYIYARKGNDQPSQ